jgi:dipeptidyl aminopeptidase/acylaminoacyl peptidase
MKQTIIVPVLSIMLLLSACASIEPSEQPYRSPNTAPSTQPAALTDARNAATQTVQKVTEMPSSRLTLEQIMADPDWLGRQPLKAQWHPLEDIPIYQRKRQGSPLRDYFIGAAANQQNGEELALEQLHFANISERQVSPDSNFIIWLHEGVLFAHDVAANLTRQLTTGARSVSNIRFMHDNKVSFQQDNHMYAMHVVTREKRHLFSWQFATAPEAVTPPQDQIAAEQIKLIDYIAQKRRERQLAADQRALQQQANPQLHAPVFYLPTKHRIAAVSVSPKGDWAVIGIRPEAGERRQSDIMPHYIQEDSRIAAVPVRERVADAKPQSDLLWLVSLEDGSQYPLSMASLPGYNDDVLAEVKRENAQAKGEQYVTNRLPRAISLFNNWYWREPPIYWHQNGEHVGIMLEAWDNKDRWIATVDFANKRLVSQHRLSDSAWINYAFNRFGWLTQETSLYYLSEEDGYSHLYVKPINGEVRQLTKGAFEVDQITLSPDGQNFFYKANKPHSGIYEVYRVSVDGKKDVQLTALNGMTDYALSPSGERLLLTHSTLTKPPELYLSSALRPSEPSKITNTISDAFKALDLPAPSIVEVPSSHVTAPIYSRLYLPSDAFAGAAKRAVIFNHGAGYLQNSHMGWSTYFREYLFHQMLTQRGYVVLDMDYRASKGYGRDWRTAIYRQMGTPEIQDLRDGVNWLVANANVDRERIGTYGGSYGGFMTFMALFTEPDLFQAGAALRPVTDWAHYNTPYTSNILNTPDIDPIAYARSSPIYFAEGLQKPLLINAPMVDDNVFFVDVVRLVQRLIELEKEHFETAIYPVEPHGFVQPSSWLDEYRRIFKLFETHL